MGAAETIAPVVLGTPSDLRVPSAMALAALGQVISHFRELYEIHQIKNMESDFGDSNTLVTYLWRLWPVRGQFVHSRSAPFGVTF
jgi:hypothetical protein